MGHKVLMILLACIIAGLLLIGSASGAMMAPSIEWQTCLGGGAHDEARAVQQTPDGGFIVAGGTNSTDGDVTGTHGDYDFWVAKLDPAGGLIWQKSLGGSDYDFAYAVQQTADGGYVVAGESLSSDGDVTENHGSADFWVVKLDAGGNLVWQNALGGGSGELGWDQANAVQQTPDGGYLVAGYTYSGNGDVSGWHGGGDFWVVKLDTGGNLVWQKCLGGTSNDEANAMQLTADGGCIVAGRSFSTDGDVTGNHGDADFWVVKLNAAGGLVWQECLGGGVDDVAHAVRQTGDGGYVVAGYTFSNDGDVTGLHGLSDGWVVKLDAAGTLVWQRCLGGTSWDDAYAVQQTTDGAYVVAGHARSNDGDVMGNHGGGWADVWVVKLDATGTPVWQKCLGGTHDDVAFAGQQTAGGGYALAGFTRSTDGDVTGNHGDFDFWVVKLNAEVVSGASFVAVPTSAPYGSAVKFTLTPAAGKTVRAAWWSFDYPAHMNTWNSRTINPTFYYPRAGTFSPYVEITYTDGTTEVVHRVDYVTATAAGTLTPTPTPTAGIPGGRIISISDDSNVTLTFVGSEAGFDNGFGLASPGTDTVYGYGLSTAPGTAWDLGPFPAGTELIFCEHSGDGYHYVTGTGSRNPDGMMHAVVTDLGNQRWQVGFEDAYGGGDQDYNDIVVEVSGMALQIVGPDAPTPTPTPTTGPYKPLAIPGRIEAEDYNHGGEGVAYHDTTKGNSGGVYRMDDVDIELFTAEGSPSVGWIRNDEWLTYTATVTTAGAYTMRARVANPNLPRTAVLSVDGVQTATITIPTTGSFGKFTTVSVPVTLAPGTHTFKLTFSGDGQNWNWLEFTTDTTPTPTSTPTLGAGASFVAVPTTAPHGSAVKFTVTPAAGKKISAAWWTFDSVAHYSTWNSRNINPTFFYPMAGTFSPLVKLSYADGSIEMVARANYIQAT